MQKHIRKKSNFKSRKELEAAILQEKINGTPDIEIGNKYGVTFRFIEKLVTKSRGINVSVLKAAKKIISCSPKDFKEEKTTVWSFKQRGKWATHSGEYRGNWSPYIPRNVILKYSKSGDVVLDYFCGAGTTAVEAKLLGRKFIGLDINDKAIELAKRNVDFSISSEPSLFADNKSKRKAFEPILLVGDARDLSFLHSNSIDLICAHPPYANIINYTDGTKGDLSFCDLNDFLTEMLKVAKESFRVLKPGRQCAILIGDMRRKKHIVPLGFRLIDVYLTAGFKLRELVIKRQHNCKTTGFWYANSIKYNFLLLAHEYLPIFEKPESPILVSDGKMRTYADTPVPIMERLPQKRKLNELETTTVWIFPENDFEKLLNENIINRYRTGHGYTSITLQSQRKKENSIIQKIPNKRNGLLFIKSTFLKNNSSPSNIKSYLKKLKTVIEKELPNLNSGAYLVIRTRDIRNEGYIEPLAKRILDTIIFDNLWLKEIVFVVKENHKQNTDSNNDGRLNIVHQYLLVYEVRQQRRNSYA